MCETFVECMSPQTFNVNNQQDIVCKCMHGHIYSCICIHIFNCIIAGCVDTPPQQAECERQEQWRHAGLVVTWPSTGFAYTQAQTSQSVRSRTSTLYGNVSAVHPKALTPLTDRHSTSGNTFPIYIQNQPPRAKKVYSLQQSQTFMILLRV